MFSLAERDLAKRILDCASGPASFNAEAHKLNQGHVVSVDPLYEFSRQEMTTLVENARSQIMPQIRANQTEFTWEKIKSPDDLEQIRMNAMRMFLEDYDLGKQQDRYIQAALPVLPYADRFFELALCSHFLLHYAEQFGLPFQIESMKELARVAREVRIYPTVELGGRESRHLTKVMEELNKSHYTAELVPVPYKFMKGANQMLRVTATSTG